MTPVSPLPTVVPLRPPSLLERLREHDPAAATMLFERHVATVERAVQGILGVDAEAEDVVQDAFMAAFKGIDGFRGEERTLGPWVRGIAVRLALRKLRWRRARRWWSRRGTEAVPTLRALGDLDTQAALSRAFALLDRLPAGERAAFGLRRIEGMRLEEVATTLGVSLATAKRRIRSARDRFARLAAGDALLSEWLNEEALR